MEDMMKEMGEILSDPKACANYKNWRRCFSTVTAKHLMHRNIQCSSRMRVRNHLGSRAALTLACC